MKRYNHIRFDIDEKLCFKIFFNNFYIFDTLSFIDSAKVVFINNNQLSVNVESKETIFWVLSSFKEHLESLLNHQKDIQRIIPDFKESSYASDYQLNSVLSLDQLEKNIDDLCAYYIWTGNYKYGVLLYSWNNKFYLEAASICWPSHYRTIKKFNQLFIRDYKVHFKIELSLITLERWHSKVTYHCDILMKNNSRLFIGV